MSLRSILAISMASTVASTMLFSVPATVLAAKAGGVETIQSASQFFATVMENPKTEIPASVLKSSHAIAIIPNIVKAGFIVAGSRGKGVLLQRQDKNQWSNPVFLTLTSGSVGLQVGGQNLNLILVFRNKHSLDALLSEDFTIGGNVSAAAGPVGREVVSTTDGRSNTDIYAYSASEGLFAGVSVEGAKVGVDRTRNREYYGETALTVQQIFTNPQLRVGPEVIQLQRALQKAIGLK